MLRTSAPICQNANRSNKIKGEDTFFAALGVCLLGNRKKSVWHCAPLRQRMLTVNLLHTTGNSYKIYFKQNQGLSSSMHAFVQVHDLRLFGMSARWCLAGTRITLRTRPTLLHGAALPALHCPSLRGSMATVYMNVLVASLTNL